MTTGTGGSYAMNFISYAPGAHTPPGSNHGWTANPAQDQKVHMSQAMHPATTVWACDYQPTGQPGYPLISSSGDVLNWHDLLATNGAYAQSKRHLDAIDFLFLEGHVKWMRPETMPYDNWWFIEEK